MENLLFKKIDNLKYLKISIISNLNIDLTLKMILQIYTINFLAHQIVLEAVFILYSLGIKIFLALKYNLIFQELHLFYNIYLYYTNFM